MKEISDIKDDAQDMVQEVQEALPYQLTRRILANEKVKNLPQGVTHVDVVCSYQSEQDIQADFLLEAHPGPESELGLLFAQPLMIPKGSNAELLLAKTVDLAKDNEFRTKRRALYEWQIQKLTRGYDPKNVLEEMTELVTSYNECVKKAMGKVYLKFAFTLGAITLGLAGTALGNPLAGASALLAVVNFATLDRKPVISPGEAAPAAMFHDIHEALGLKFAFPST